MYTHTKKPKRTKEHNSGELKVERQGYRTAERQINDLIDAGRRLEQSRKEEYFDFQEGEEIDDERQFPDRAPNFDMADASAIAEVTTAKLEAQEKTIAAEKAEKIKAKKAKAEADKKELDEFRKNKTEVSEE